MSKRLTYEYVKEYFKKEGCELLEKEYINNYTKMKYVIRCRHENKIGFYTFQDGGGRLCLKCSKVKQNNKQKNSYTDVKKYFEKEGCKLLSKEYINNSIKLKYRTRCNHFFEIGFKSFNKGRGRYCPECALIIKTFKVGEYFKKEGCKLIEKEYVDNNTKISYITRCGHTNLIYFSKFRRGQGRLCPKCVIKIRALKRKLSYKYVKNYFEKEGCQLIDKKYVNDTLKLKYIAKCGHSHIIRFQTFRAGLGRVCTKCGYPRGENHHSWNPNLANKDRMRRRGQKSNIWRKAVFEKNKYICQMTGKKGGTLVAHHLKPYHKYKDLRFEVSNGITLSEEFHKFVHKIFGYKIEIDLNKLNKAKFLWNNR